MLFSLIAIFVSVTTARRENKIALFGKRYDCLFQLKNILAFSESIRDVKENQAILVLSLFEIHDFINSNNITLKYGEVFNVSNYDFTGDISGDFHIYQ